MYIKHKISKFWEPGFSLFSDALKDEERERLAPLKAELKRASDAEHKSKLKQEIAAIRAEFGRKRHAAKHSLFLGFGNRKQKSNRQQDLPNKCGEAEQNG